MRFDFKLLNKSLKIIHYKIYDGTSNEKSELSDQVQPRFSTNTYKTRGLENYRRCRNAFS